MLPLSQTYLVLEVVMNTIESSTLIQLLLQSDAMTYVVFACLLIMSIYTWAVLFYKIIVWRVKRKQLDHLLFQLQNSSTVHDVVQLNSAISDTYAGYFLAKILHQFKLVSSKGSSRSNDLSDREWQILESSLSGVIESLMTKESSLVTIVAACMTIAPLLGLYGTVWGLVISFMDIGRQQSADIATVAPGISMALTTTVGGLLVAIPAAVIYYVLQMKMQAIESRLVLVTERFMLLVQHANSSKV